MEIPFAKIDMICKAAMKSIVSNDYTFLREQNALTRVSEADIKRVLAEYDPDHSPMMPPDPPFFKESSRINVYTDGSGYFVCINFWYLSGQSDLELQLDIRKQGDGLCFIINDILVP